MGQANEKSLANLKPHQWKPGQTGNPKGSSTGRTAGFRHFTAKLYAAMLDARVSEPTDDKPSVPISKDDPTYEKGIPFPIAALNLYMQRVLSPRAQGEALFDFVERLLPHLDELDGILQNQRTQDLKFLTYLLYRYCFDEQRAVLMTIKRLIVLICGRRAGKTVVIACLLIMVAISHEKGDVLYLGRTAKSAYDIIWRTLIDILEYIGMPYKANIADQTIVFNTGVTIFVKGTASKADIENLRGLGLRLAVKDETQSDSYSKLKMLVEEILAPATKDYEGSQVLLSGTPPRIEGSYQEEKYNELSANTARFNWNMSVNPNIPHHETILEETLAEDFKGNASDSTYLREHVGKIGAYDTEALVFRITAANHYREADLVAWVTGQPVTDIFFVGGIDYGFDDYDSCVIIMASVNKPERFKLYGYKGNRTGITDFVDKMRLGLRRVLENPMYSRLPKENRQVTWYCDTEGLGKKITYEIAQQFNLSVSPAYQGQPDVMLEMLQDEVKFGRWKHPAPQTVDGKVIVDDFEEEAKHIVFARDEEKPGAPLTRHIDDDVFHPEQTKSILYSMRTVWLKSKVKMGGKT